MRSVGVDAWGWLPTTKDAADLAAYAERQGASLVLVPPELEQPGLVDRLVGREGAAEADAHTPVRSRPSAEARAASVAITQRG